MDKEFQKINVAQIGIGYWGPNLLRNLFSNKNCSIKTVVDLSSSRREYVRSYYPGIDVNNDVKSVFNDDEIQAVVIATPAATHFDLVMEALKAGKHVLVEKPMAMNVKEVEQIEKLSTENNLIAMVGHTFLYNSAVIYIKKLIENNELGDIRYIYCQRLNLGRIRDDVDALWSLAPHDISILQYWLNNPDPIKVSRVGMDYVQKGIDDVVFLNLEYPNNVMANIHISWLDPRKTRTITIVGSKKMVVYDDIADDKVVIYDKGIDPIMNLGENMDFDSPNGIMYSHRSGDISIPKINWIEPLKAEIQHFITCVINGEKCLSDSSHAKKVISILSAN